MRIDIRLSDVPLFLCALVVSGVLRAACVGMNDISILGFAGHLRRTPDQGQVGPSLREPIFQRASMRLPDPAIQLSCSIAILCRSFQLSADHRDSFAPS